MLNGIQAIVDGKDDGGVVEDPAARIARLDTKLQRAMEKKSEFDRRCVMGATLTIHLSSQSSVMVLNTKRSLD